MAGHRSRGVGAPCSEGGVRGSRVLPGCSRQGSRALVRLARNHPLPDGNKRVAYLALLEFLARNGIEWVPPSVDETVATIEAVAAGAVSESELAEWLRTTAR